MHGKALARRGELQEGERLARTAVAFAEETDMLNAPADALIDFAEVLARAKGTIEVKIRNSSSLEYRLTYSGLSGSGSQAHIHFAQLGVNGGIAAFLCGGGGKAACPGASGSVSGTIAAGEIKPAGQTTAQWLLVNEMSELIAVIRAGVTYANVHTAAFPGGELRGQTRRAAEAPTTTSDCLEPGGPKGAPGSKGSSRRHSAGLRLRQRTHPAYIPREVAGNRR